MGAEDSADLEGVCTTIGRHINPDGKRVVDQCIIFNF